MIGRLRGTVVDRQPDGSCILDVGGVGYEVFVPLGALGRLPAPPEAVTLHVHTHVREEAFVLYGFGRLEDRTAFRTLLGVSSVGPKLALAILSALDARQLAAAIAAQDAARFKGIPGVGKKIVERLLLELKDKLGFVTVASLPIVPVASAPSADASAPLSIVASLLVGMGFKPHEADRAVAKIAPDAEGASVEDLMKKALAHLG